MLDFRGLIEQALKALDEDRPADAEKGIRSALAMSPRDDQLLHLLGVSLIRQQREEEALEPLRKAISINRRDAEYHNALGCALRGSGEMAAGIESLQRALKLDPALTDARFNLGQTYQGHGDFDLAESTFRKMLADNPADIEVIGALSSLHWIRGDRERAVDALRDGIRQHPGSGDMRFLLADQLLALGRFEEGWYGYLWRVNRHAFLRRMGLPFDSPTLMTPFSRSLEGLTVRVHGEQGIGDDLFFLRFVPELRARGARVEGAMTDRLLGMIGRSGVLDSCVSAPERIPPDAGYRLLGDLPFLLAAHERPVPPSIRFAPLPEKMEEIAAKLRGLPRPLIGLTWRAGTGPESGNRNVLYKTASFNAFVDMARDLPGSLLVLQRQPKPGEFEKLAQVCGPRVTDFSALNADLEAMLALLAQIDEYVGVSNTNMHLCAGLGRIARVLASRGVEFRWMADGRESPWFPGFPVYRQGPAGDWTEAMKAIRNDVSS